MRPITYHIANPTNDRLNIFADDNTGSGGANHAYTIQNEENGEMWPLRFQDGPINEVGVNGITQEALLAIIIDRLRSFQAGPFSCRENALALTKCEEAMHWLHHRTRDRVERGVEGQTKT